MCLVMELGHMYCTEEFYGPQSKGNSMLSQSDLTMDFEYFMEMKERTGMQEPCYILLKV